MNKRIIRAMMAGVVAANALGTAGLVRAYDGPTVYPENSHKELVITMIDPRHNTLSMVYTPEYWRNGKFKGVKFFGGEIDDDLLIRTYPGEEHGEVEYLRYEMDMENWEELENGVEKTFTGTEMTRDLSENTAGTLAYYFQYLAGWDEPMMNHWKVRTNYSRCSNSEAYTINPAVVCRAEIWADGELHYQPYIGWDRLFLPDDPEGVEEQVQVFKDGAWVVAREDEPEEEFGDGGEGDEYEGDEGDEYEDGEGGVGGEGEDKKPEVVYVEVPVEKIVLKEIVKNVPIENTVVKEVVKEKPVEIVKETIKEVPVEKVVEKKVVEQVEVQVPVEKTVVTEVIKEVPVGTLGAGDELVLASKEMGEVETSNGEGEVSEDGETEGDKDEVEIEGIDEAGLDVNRVETIEVPELGGQSKASGDLAGRVATFIAGVISAVGMLFLAIAYRRKKEDSGDTE